MGFLEEDDEGLGLMGQALDHAYVAGSVPFNVQLEHRWFAGILLSSLKKVFPCIPVNSVEL